MFTKKSCPRSNFFVSSLLTNSKLTIETGIHQIISRKIKTFVNGQGEKTTNSYNSQYLPKKDIPILSHFLEAGFAI